MIENLSLYFFYCLFFVLNFSICHADPKFAVIFWKDFVHCIHCRRSGQKLPDGKLGTNWSSPQLNSKKIESSLAPALRYLKILTKFWSNFQQARIFLFSQNHKSFQFVMIDILETSLFESQNCIWVGGNVGHFCANFKGRWVLEVLNDAQHFV